MKESFKEEVLPSLVETKELFKIKDEYDIPILTYMDLGAELKEIYHDNHNNIIAALRAIKLFRDNGFEISYKGKEEKKIKYQNGSNFEAQ